MKLKIVIIIYDRLNNLLTWLRCWPLCEQHGAELVILHTGPDDWSEHCKGVTYIRRKNQGMDVGCTQDVFKERLDNFPNDWDYLLWVTDDVIPMKRDFLAPYIRYIQKPDTGCACMMISHTPVSHVRTVAYMVSKETSLKIEFPFDPMMDKSQGYIYEYKGGNKTLTQQIHAMGKKCRQVEDNDVAGLWDTGYGKRLERLHEHYKAFPIPEKPVTIHHFYHIYADGKWQEPVEEHIRALKMGLADQLTTFNIGIVGDKSNRRMVKQYLVDQGIYFNIIAQAPKGWEAVTQQPMHDFAQSNDGLILYAHSKGSSDPSDVNIRWRRSMIYWNIIRWEDCVKKLKTHETVGCHWIYPSISMPEHKYGNPMYAGTFYWVKSELLRTWIRVPLTHRYESEGWVGYKYVQKPWPLWDWTPYFPNTNHFADDWVNDDNFKGVETGVSVPAIVLHDKQVADG